MVRFFTSLIVTVVIVAAVVIAWAPTAKSGYGYPIPPDQCDDFCQTQTICMCAKLLGGSLRLTQCVIAPNCGPVVGDNLWTDGNFCDCTSATPVCKPWEFPLKAQELPFELQECCPTGGPLPC